MKYGFDQATSTSSNIHRHNSSNSNKVFERFVSSSTSQHLEGRVDATVCTATSEPQTFRSSAACLSASELPTDTRPAPDVMSSSGFGSLHNSSVSFKLLVHCCAYCSAFVIGFAQNCGVSWQGMALTNAFPKEVCRELLDALVRDMALTFCRWFLFLGVLLTLHLLRCVTQKEQRHL